MSRRNRRRSKRRRRRDLIANGECDLETIELGHSREFVTDEEVPLLIGTPQMGLGKRKGEEANEVETEKEKEKERSKRRRGEEKERRKKRRTLRWSKRRLPSGPTNATEL